MSEMTSDILLGVAAFVAGVVCGMTVVGPKIYAAVSGTLNEMSHDLNPRRDLPA